MYIFEFEVPGSELDYEDREWAIEIENLLRSLQTQFIEANLSLNLFVRSLRERQNEGSRKEVRRQDWLRRQEIHKIVEAEIGNRVVLGDWQEVYLETEIRFKRELWDSGRQPSQFEHYTQFLYARSFLYALDGFDKFLKVLSKTKDVPAEVAAQFQQMAEKFPDLRGVRNTVQHLEDRARLLGEPPGRGKPPQPLDLKPIDKDGINAPSGALMLNHLRGSNYGSTMADGHFGEVDVSPESMEALRVILHAVLRAFAWKGWKQHLPSA